MYGLWPARSPSLDDPAIACGAAILRRGGLVAFPTETVYGLGANALDPKAVLSIFQAKGRPLSDPLIVHVAHRGALAGVARGMPRAAERLADAFWPGPLTLVLPRDPAIPPEVSAGLDTVAVRIPSHPVARALLRAAGVPVAAPSANRFSRPSPTTALHVAGDLGDHIDALIDGGPTQVGIESTIVRADEAGITLLRPGGISREDLEAVVGPVRFLEGRASAEGEAAPAPGSLLRHYAPTADLYLVDGPRGEALPWIHAQSAAHRAAGRAVGILVSDDDAQALSAEGLTVFSLGSEGDAAAAAQRLYACLRQLDGAGVDVILARMPPAVGLGLGLRDRLFRAAVGRVTRLQSPVGSGMS